MKTVTFITGHYYQSKRRAGFHNLADAAHALGYRVNFVTVGYSLLSFLRINDYRVRIPGIRRNHNRLLKIKDDFYSYVHFTKWHPMTLVLPFLNTLSMSWMDAYDQANFDKLLPIIRQTDIFVFESCPGLFLFSRIKRENPHARMVYRVSDDIRILGSTHPRMVELEQQIVSQFDCVSVPSSVMQSQFPGVTARLDRHGLDKVSYDACTVSPYAPGSINAVFVGTGYMDYEFLQAVAPQNENCLFHIIGPIKDKLNMPNVRFLGEMSFALTLPYIKFANVGLAIRTFRNGYAATLTDSLKIIQYRYCGLPIISPDFIDLHREGVFYYTPGNAPSCRAALQHGLQHGHDAGFAQEVRTWKEVAAELLVNSVAQS